MADIMKLLSWYQVLCHGIIDFMKAGINLKQKSGKYYVVFYFLVDKKV